MPEVIIPVTVLMLAVTLGGIYAAKRYTDWLRDRQVQRNWDDALAEIDAFQAEAAADEMLAALELPDLPDGYEWNAHLCGENLHIAILGEEDGEDVIYREGLLLNVEALPGPVLEALIRQMAGDMAEGIADPE